MSINQGLLKTLHKNEKLLIAFDAKSSYPSAMSDKDSFCPRIETIYLFAPDKEEDFIN